MVTDHFRELQWSAQRHSFLTDDFVTVAAAFPSSLMSSVGTVAIIAADSDVTLDDIIIQSSAEGLELSFETNGWTIPDERIFGLPVPLVIYNGSPSQDFPIMGVGDGLAVLVLGWILAAHVPRIGSARSALGRMLALLLAISLGYTGGMSAGILIRCGLIFLDLYHQALEFFPMIIGLAGAATLSVASGLSFKS